MADYKTRLTELQKHFLDIAGTISSTVLTEEDSLRYATFTARMEQLNQMADNFVTPAADGSLPLMDQVSLDAFRKSYRRTIDSCQQVIDENKNDGVSAQMKRLAKETMTHLLADLSALESVSIDEAANLTLDKILELGNSLTVDIGDQKASGKGQALSSRIPIRVPDAPGGGLDGYFTKSVHVDTDGDLRRMFDAQRSKYPELKELLDALEKVDQKELFDSPFANASLARVLEHEASRNNVPYPTTKEDMETLARNYYTRALENVMDDDVLFRNSHKANFVRSMSEVATEFSAIVLRRGLYVADRKRWLGTKEGSNIDKRNAAMSSVSNLLGKKGLIAEAKPMVVRMNGNTYAGTFMENAPGYDAYDGKKDNPMRKLHSRDYNNPDLFDDIAALQAIDYICGNLDRHPGNFRMQFVDENGKKKPVRIIAIDNDMSFGLLTPESHPDPKNPLGKPYVLPKEMCAIGESTARKIEMLTKDQLTLTLRGYDLSTEEIDAAWRRTEILQNAIKNGRSHYKDIPHGKIDKGFLRVVPEADWDKYSLGKLAVENNQFRAIGKLRDSVLERDKIHDKENRRKQRQEEAMEILYGVPKQVKEEPRPVIGVPVGNGLLYSVPNADPLGVNAPGTLRMVLPAGAEPDAVGGSYNRRIALSIKNAGEHPREGFFTAAADIKGRAQMRILIEQTIREQEKEHPKWAEVIRRSATTLLQDGKTILGNPDYDLRDIGLSKAEDTELKNDPEFREFYRVFRARAGMVHVGRGLYGQIGANDDGFIEKRNVAMSRLSDALGCSGCIVHAEPMQVEQDGKITDGIFMDRVDGRNYQDFRREDEEVRQGIRAFDGSDALKDLADIQVMDYICFNIDRNENNMMFQYSEDKKKCLHVVGIDNDLSFGSKRLDPDDNISQGTALNDILVISEGQAAKIREMNEIDFRNAIGDQGLTDAEYRAARERLMNIRNRINSGAIRIVKDDEWKNETLETLASPGTIFHNLKSNLTDGLEHRLTSLEEMEAQGIKEEPKEVHFTEGQMVKEFSAESKAATELQERTELEKDLYSEKLLNRFSKGPSTRSLTGRKLMDYMEFFSKAYLERVEGQDSILHGKTAYFTNMMTAAKNFKDLVQQKNDAVEDGFDISEEYTNELLESMKALRTAAKGYTSHVQDILEREGSISRTQRKRNAMAESLTEDLNAIIRGMKQEINIREAETHPDRRLYAEIGALQEALSAPIQDEQQSNRNLAKMIYLSGLSHNVFKLSAEKKLSTAMGRNGMQQGVNEVLTSPAFTNILREKGRDALVQLACKDNGERLFTTFAESLAKIELKPKRRAPQPAPKKEPHL